MPLLSRPDGIDIHWEERGEGPLVTLCTHFYAFPSVLSALLDDLARDHRVLTYDMRGCGRSTRSGPYDVDTDTDDLEAVVEARGGAAVVIGFGEGAVRATKLAARRTDLAGAVVAIGGSPGPIRRLREREGMAESPSVRQAMREMMNRDYRSGLRTLIASTSSQMSEEEIRERVSQTAAYSSHDATLARFEHWRAEDAIEDAVAIGDRLTIQHFSTPWFPTGSAARLREMLPAARIDEVPEGAISRPDIAAAAVRRITCGPSEAAGESVTRK